MAAEHFQRFRADVHGGDAAQMRGKGQRQKTKPAACVADVSRWRDLRQQPVGNALVKICVQRGILHKVQGIGVPESVHRHSPAMLGTSMRPTGVSAKDTDTPYRSEISALVSTCRGSPRAATRPPDSASSRLENISAC